MNELILSVLITFCSQNFKTEIAKNYCLEEMQHCLIHKMDKDWNKFDTALDFCAERI